MDQEDQEGQEGQEGDGQDTHPSETDMTFSLDAGGFSPTWTSGTEMRIWQIVDGKAVESRTARIAYTGSLPTLGATFPCRDSADVAYAVCGPARSVTPEGVCTIMPSQTSAFGIPYPDCDIVLGCGRESSDAAGSIRVPVQRLGAVVILNIEGMLQGDAIRSVQLTFPDHVCGPATFSPADGTVTVDTLSSYRQISVNTTAAKGIAIRTFPLDLPSGAHIGIKVTSSLTSYSTELTLGDAVHADHGDTLNLACQFKSAKTFKNPVWTKSFADPTIWRDGNTFYATATGLGSTLRSTDLVNWSGMGGGPYSSSAKSTAQSIGKDLWAPDMIKFGDTWRLYISCVDSGVRNVIGVASSKTIAKGAWQWTGIVTDSNVSGISATIDPEVVVDPATGKVWLFFGSTKKIWRVELNSEGTALAPGAQYVHVAGKNIDKTNDPQRQTVFEGAYLHRHGDYWYLFVSAGQYAAANYKVLVGRSATLDGVFYDRQGRNMTQGVGTRVLYSDKGDRFYGPGHNGEIFTDKTGQDYILYHCHDSSTGTETRFLFLQRLFWDAEGWPFMETGKPLEVDVAPVF